MNFLAQYRLNLPPFVVIFEISIIILLAQVIVIAHHLNISWRVLILTQNAGTFEHMSGRSKIGLYSAL